MAKDKFGRFIKSAGSVDDGSAADASGTEAIEPDSGVPVDIPDTINGFDAIDPGGIGDGGSGDGGRPSGGKHRGRKPGSKNKPAAPDPAASKTQANIVEELLTSVHFILAASLDCPELVLKDVEARRFARALNRIAEHYEKVLDPKYGVWGNLLAVLATIYGVRAYKIWQRKAAEAGSRPAPRQNVSEMPSRPAPGGAGAGSMGGGGWAAQSPSEVFGDYMAAPVPEVS